MDEKPLGGFMKNKVTKIGGGLVGGTGLVAIFFGLQTDYTDRINKAQASTKIYVDQQHELVVQETHHLKQGQEHILRMIEANTGLLRIIDKRLYDLKTQNK